MGTRMTCEEYRAALVDQDVGDSDTPDKAAFEAHRAELGERTFEEARPLLARSVEREKREAVLAAMVADLRARAEVRVLFDVAGGAAP